MLKDVLAVGKALSDKNRVRALMALHVEGDLCVCQITQLLGLAMPTVSRHMSILLDSGLVATYKVGRWVHYRPAVPANPAGQSIVDWIRFECQRDDFIQKDLRQLPSLRRCGEVAKPIVREGT